MEPNREEEELLRSAALRNSNTILLARQRSEQELIRAKEELELKTAKLAHSLSTIRATLESTTDGILVTDLDGRVTDLNEKCLQMWGFLREEMSVKKHQQLQEACAGQLKNPGRFLARIDEIYASWPPETFDLLEFVDGRVFERYSRIQWIDQKPVGRVWSYRDITDHRRKEKDLARIYEAEQQANSTKDHFLAALSHELRTPLTPVLAILSSLLEAPGLPKDLAADLETIRRNVEMEARLIDDLLDLTRITSGKLELHYEFTGADRLIESAIDICRAGLENKGLSLVREFGASQRPIHVDRVRITQILWNLLKNAIKFTPEGGTVTVRSRTTTTEGLEWLVIEVRDTGIGMEGNERERIFKPFEQGGRKITRQYGGLGLGLSISDGIAAAHGGHLAAASEGIGRGSAFTLTLPYPEWDESKPQIEEAPPRVQPVESDADTAPVSGRRRRILLVEDHADTAAILLRLLRRLGYETVHAGTVVEALRIAKFETQGAGIDLVISDVGLPDGSGLDMMRELSGSYGLRGVAISGYGTEADLERSAAAGFMRHLIKPVGVGALRDTVASVLSGA